ncbi:MAG: hypothetical protein AAF702_28080 [Chloroflexota bacterium]
MKNRTEVAAPSLASMFSPPSALDMEWVVKGSNGKEITMLNPVMLSPEHERHNQEVMTISQHYDLDVKRAFAMELFSGQFTVEHPQTNTEWMICPLAECPQYNDKDGTPLPPEPRKKIVEAQKYLGRHFDTYYIAHQMILGTSVGGPITAEMLAPPPSRVAQQKAEVLGNASSGLWNMLGKLGLGIGITAGAAVGAVAAGPVAAVGLAALLLLDPILFGVVKEPSQPLAEGTMSQFFFITAWDYQEPQSQVGLVKALTG